MLEDAESKLRDKKGKLRDKEGAKKNSRELQEDPTKFGSHDPSSLSRDYELSRSGYTL